MCGNIYPAKEKNKKQEKNPALFCSGMAFTILAMHSQKIILQINCRRR